MHRRTFFQLLGGAVAGVVGAMLPWRRARPQWSTAHYVRLDAPPHSEWPATYALMVRLPQPANRPVENPLGIGYWLEYRSELVNCDHFGNGFYVGEHSGMKLRAIAEKSGDKLICKNVVWEGEWNADDNGKIDHEYFTGNLDRLGGLNA